MFKPVKDRDAELYMITIVLKDNNPRSLMSKYFMFLTVLRRANDPIIPNKTEEENSEFANNNTNWKPIQ